MRKSYLFLLLLFSLPVLGFGQTYGNEWINYSQKYYKIKVIKDGIYRIDSAALANSGIAVGNLNPKNFQVFFRGKEQYIYVQNKIPGVFGGNDFIEFYGQHNDGLLDSLVYTGIAFNPNPYYSMFNDTSTYYLTWNTSTSNHRLAAVSNTSYRPVSDPYFTAETVNYGNTEFYGGFRNQVGGLTNSDPHYTPAEGWFNLEMDLGAVQAYTLNIANVDTSGPTAIISTVILGESTALVSPDHRVQMYGSWKNHGATVIDDTMFDDSFPVFKKTFPVAPGKLTGGVTMTFKSAPVGNVTSNITAISYVYASYPHDTCMGGASNFMLYAPATPNNNYYDLSNLNIVGADSVLFYDFTNHNRLKVTQSGTRVQVVIPGNNVKQCYITTVSQVIYPTKLIPVGNAGTFTSFVPVTRSKPYIIVTHPSLMAAASAYATYRSRKFEPILANVEELYDQFGYGVEKDPLGIRRFCNYAVNTWRIPPAYLFLVGKGIHTPLYRQDATNYQECLVPSFGYPSSDILLSAGFTNNTLTPSIPTGRLAAVTGTDVSTYLGKVETFEGNAPALWMKNVIHFCGGSYLAEINYFLTFLTGYANIIKNPYFGANVYTFEKSNSQPIQITIADSVTNLINNGVSIMTFFGHASGNSFDVSLDAPSDYNNVGKYPLIIANACFSGDIFQPPGAGESSTSEQFVLDPKGSIGFLAMDDLGIAGELGEYTTTLYQNIAFNMYRKSIGLCIQNTISQNQGQDLPQEPITCMEMTLHGDPAIAINFGDSLPDYVINDSSVSFLPANVTTQLDSFKVKVVVTNQGEATNTPVQLTLVRTFPNGTTATYNTTFNHVYYADTATFTLPVNKAIGPGENWFLATADPSNLIRELSENNNSNNHANSRGTLLWITSGDIIPVLPYDFAIIPKDSATLKASTGNPYAPPRNYIFQIDTTDNFNSPWLKSQIVYAAGGVVCASPFDWQNTPAPIPNPAGNGNNQHVFNAGALKINNSVNNETGLHGAAIQPNSQQSKIMPALPSTGIKLNNASTSNIPNTANSANTLSIHSPGKQGLSSANMVNPSNTEGTIVQHRLRSGPYLQFTDSTVYYWRVRYDSGSYNQHPWGESSFQYITGKTGWAQAHLFQFRNNLYNYMGINLQPRNWSFVQAGKTLECDDYGFTPSEYLSNQGLYLQDLFSTCYKLDLATDGSNTCQATPAVGIVVIDQLSLQPWSPATYNFNQANNGNNALCAPALSYGKPFIFWDTCHAQQNGMINLLNAVPKGDYVLAYTFFDGCFSQWSDTAAKTAFLRLLPTSQIKNPAIAKDSIPWIFFVQKGGAGAEMWGRYSKDTLVYKTNLVNRQYSGTMLSPLIGPAQKWDSLSWLQHAWKGSRADSTRLNVIGVDQYGNSKTLLPGITPSVATMYLHSISPQQYPYLQFMLYTKDTLTQWPSQMRKWQVFYTPVPEVAVNPSIYSYFHTDSLQAGDSIYYKTVVQNISNYPIDSMIYNSWVVDAGNATHNFPSQITKKLNPGDTTMIRIKAPSAGYYGNNSVWIEVNPLYQNLTRNEQTHFNNLTRQYFYVIGDKINPLLDVTFDGIHILNNDVVSPTPNIVMQLMDENKFLALNDPTDFAVFIRNINDPTPTKVLFGPQLTFTPAVLPKNSCKLNYTPALSDGTYELTVQAKDRSGNASGANSYLIDFEVVNKPMISNVLNYPNPFSTSTRFVFTLTGSQVPTLFTIQIMTITGRVVKEITQDQIGPLHIGRNITEYAWDGTDQFGDKLANGIYLYRIITSLDGQALGLYSSGADQYFTKGMGKMYLIR